MMVFGVGLFICLLCVMLVGVFCGGLYVDWMLRCVLL